MILGWLISQQEPEKTKQYLNNCLHVNPLLNIRWHSDPALFIYRYIHIIWHKTSHNENWPGFLQVYDGS